MQILLATNVSSFTETQLGAGVVVQPKARITLFHLSTLDISPCKQATKDSSAMTAFERHVAKDTTLPSCCNGTSGLCVQLLYLRTQRS